MKVVQYSTTRCGWCPPAWSRVQEITNEGDRVLVLFDTNEVTTGEENLSDETMAELSSNISTLVGKTGRPQSVPSFVIVENDFTPITGIIDKEQMEQHVKEFKTESNIELG